MVTLVKHGHMDPIDLWVRQQPPDPQVPEASRDLPLVMVRLR